MAEIPLILPGFENVPFKDADLMTAKRSYNDYYLTITPAGLAKLADRTVFQEYQPLSVPVDTDGPMPETVALTFCRDTTIMWREAHMNPAVIEYDQQGMTIWLYPPALKPALEGEFFMTRYDGHTNKLWIRYDPGLPAEVL